jgi:hypothetical protein
MYSLPTMIIIVKTQGYIVRFGQCSVFLIPINKRRRWKLVLSLTDGALYCSKERHHREKIVKSRKVHTAMALIIVYGSI